MRKNLLVAQTVAREMGVVGLDEALELVVLTAELEPNRLDAYARRWLARLADERTLTLAELDLAVTALRALPSPALPMRCVALSGNAVSSATNWQRVRRRVTSMKRPGKRGGSARVDACTREFDRPGGPLIQHSHMPAGGVARGTSRPSRRALTRSIRPLLVRRPQTCARAAALQAFAPRTGAIPPAWLPRPARVRA